MATGENPWRAGRENHLRPNGVQESSATMGRNNCLAFEPTGSAAFHPWLPADALAELDCSLVKNVFLFKFDVVRPEKGQQFFAERFYLMMLLLPLDVILYHRNLRLTDGKNAITLLPRKITQRRKRFMDPARRICLQIPDQGGDALIGPPPKQDMNVVGDAANFKQHPFFSADDSSQIIVNSWTDIVLQPRFTMFRAENEVEFEIMVGSGHEMSLVCRPFGTEDLYSLLFPRVPLHSTRGHQPKLLRSSD